jgi:hypothetical protein
MGKPGGVRSLQSFEHLREEGRLSLSATLCWKFPVLELVLCVTDATAGLFDGVVDHRHDGVIRDTAFARTIIVQHVAGPVPALLHALPRKPKSDHCAGGKRH